MFTDQPHEICNLIDSSTRGSLGKFGMSVIHGKLLVCCHKLILSRKQPEAMFPKLFPYHSWPGTTGLFEFFFSKTLLAFSVCPCTAEIPGGLIVLGSLKKSSSHAGHTVILPFPRCALAAAKVIRPSSLLAKSPDLSIILTDLNLPLRCIPLATNWFRNAI